MKKQHPIRTLLDLTQEQIAMMLGVSRAHWGMYELGKRDLPLQPKERLAEMLKFLKTIESDEKHLRVQESKADVEHAGRLLKENEFRRLTLEKKLTAAEGKHNAQIRLSLLADFFENRAAKDKSKDIRLGFPKNGKDLNVKQDHDALLAEYRHQMALLNFEKELLESKLKK